MPLIVPQQSGVAGVRQTMANMVALVNGAYLHERIRRQAAGAIAHCPRGDKRCQCASLLAYVKRVMHYIPDPAEAEGLHNPVMVAQGIDEKRFVYGDCDDFSMYLAALMKSVGLRPRFRAVGYNGGPFKHIYVTCDGMKLDATRDDWNVSLGSTLPETCSLEENV